MDLQSMRSRMIYLRKNIESVQNKISTATYILYEMEELLMDAEDARYQKKYGKKNCHQWHQTPNIKCLNQKGQRQE